MEATFVIAALSVVFSTYYLSAFLCRDVSKKLLEMTQPITALTCDQDWENLIASGPEMIPNHLNKNCILPRLDTNRGGDETNAARRIIRNFIKSCPDNGGKCL